MTNFASLRKKDRSISTRDRLVNAALEILENEGLEAVSFVSVCERANLSRGAIHYHFDAPHELFGEVVIAIYRNMEASVTKHVRLQKETASIGSLIDALWCEFKSDRFRGLLQLRCAAATDPVLAASIARPNDEIGSQAMARFSQSSHVALDVSSTRLLFAALTGLSIQYSSFAGLDRAAADQYAVEFIDQLKEFFHA